MNRNDYTTPICDKFILGLGEYFKIDRDEVIRRGDVPDYEVFDSKFTPEVLERNDEKEIRELYNSDFFAFRNIIYYANREEKAFEPFWKPIVDKQGSVLDHGGGAGVFIEVLLRKGVKDITYTDVPSPTFEFVRWFFGSNIKYETEPDNIVGKYDYICSNSVLEHLPDPVKIVKMLGKHLNKGGRLIVSMAQDIHGQHLKKAIDKYDEVMDLVKEINEST